MVRKWNGHIRGIQIVEFYFSCTWCTDVYSLNVYYYGMECGKKDMWVFGCGCVLVRVCYIPEFRLCLNPIGLWLLWSLCCFACTLITISNTNNVNTVLYLLYIFSSFTPFTNILFLYLFPYLYNNFLLIS